MSDLYPEHEKLKKIADQSQACGEFIDWLSMQGIFLAKHYMFDRDDRVTDDEGASRYSRTQPVARDTVSLLAEFFEIDQNKIEAEKREMLRKCQEMAS